MFIIGLFAAGCVSRSSAGPLLMCVSMVAFMFFLTCVLFLLRHRYSLGVLHGWFFIPPALQFSTFWFDCYAWGFRVVIWLFVLVANNPLASYPYCSLICVYMLLFLLCAFCFPLSTIGHHR